MTTTFDSVAAALTDSLNDKENRVIALTGPWGSGKTHLWRRIRDSAYAGAAKARLPIYVSVFGAKTATELKFRILQAAYLDDASSVQRVARTGGGLLNSALSHWLGVTLEDAALLWLPKLVGGRLIVIDDVERKHSSLCSDELLGVIDEYSERYDVQFLLVFNSDKILDAETWATLHEKVIDTEIVLKPTPAEAFDVAAAGYSGPFLEAVRDAIRILGVTNIRVIRKVLVTMRKIAVRVCIDPAVPASRIVPSVALLTAIHFRGVASGITMHYVRHFNSDMERFKEKGDKSPEELQWDDLLDRLGIRGADEFERVICDFLQSGVLDKDALARILAAYKKDAMDVERHERISAFFDAYYWTPGIESFQLVGMAQQFAVYASRMSPSEISHVVQCLEGLDAHGVAEELRAAWIVASNDRPEYKDLTEDSFEHPARPLDPKVLAHIRQLKEKCTPRLSLSEAIRRMRANSGWGEPERRAFRESTEAEYQLTLSTIAGDELARFVKEHCQWLRGGVPDGDFEVGAENFLRACKSIWNQAPKSRLALIIERAFKTFGVADKVG